MREQTCVAGSPLRKRSESARPLRMLLNTVLILSSLLLLGAAPETALAGPVAHLVLQGEEIDEQVDYIALGRTYNVTTGNWSASLLDENRDGLVDSVDFHVSNLPPSLGLFWSVSFSTRKMGINLQPGRYTNAMRYPFEDPGRPGISISGEGRGHNTNNGNFTISDIEIDYSGSMPRVVRFAVSFEQWGGDSPVGPATRGSFLYRDDGGSIGSFPPYVSFGSYLERRMVVRLKGGNFSPGAQLKIDGVLVPVGKVKPSKIQSKKVTLSSGLHTAVVVNPDGTESVSYQFPVFANASGQSDGSEPLEPLEEEPLPNH